MFGGLAIRNGDLFVGHGVGRGRVTLFRAATLEPLFDFALADGRRRPFTPAGLAVGTSFAIHVCDPAAGAVHRYSIFGKRQGTIAGVAVKGKAPRAIRGRRLPPVACALPDPDRRGVLAEPAALDIDERGNVYVTSGAGPRVHAVQKFTGEGRFLGSYRAFGCPGETFNGPRGLALSSQHLYVADTGNGAVHVFRRGGGFCQVFSTAASHGERSIPAAIALDGPDGLLILDRGDAPALKRFSRSGEPRGAILTDADVRDPVAVARGEAGEICLLDLDGARLRAFTRTGSLTAERSLVETAPAAARRARLVPIAESRSESELAT